MSTRSQLADLLGRIQGGYSKAAEAHVPVSRAPVAPQHDDEDVPVGLPGVMAATEKLLAVNRGLVEPDERDSLEFKRVMSVDQHLRERVRLDADKVRLNILRRASRVKNLNGLHAFVFDTYSTGQLLGNSLSAPGEEINPLQNLEQSRRITQMGPGGLGSSQAVTSEAQNVHPSQFGFISPLEGPECHDPDTEVFTRKGWVFWPAVDLNTEFACQVDGHMEFHKASRVVRSPFKGTLYGGTSRGMRFLVTPNHRMWSVANHGQENWNWELAEHQHTKDRQYKAAVEWPYTGTTNPEFFELPTVPCRTTGQNNMKIIPPIPMGDWVEFLGWYLSEGSTYDGQRTGNNRYRVCISQSKTASPVECGYLERFLNTLPFGKWNHTGHNFHLKSKQLSVYLSQFGYRAEKFIPEFVFDLPPELRARMLRALQSGDGHLRDHGSEVFSTSSPELAKGVERLMLGLGMAVSVGKWKAKYDTRFTWMYSVSKLMARVVSTSSKNRYTKDFDGIVYCATVPGSLLFTRRGSSRGFWSGNSENAGIDSRVAMGVKLGSDGQLYQKFLDRRAGKHKWMTPADVAAHVMKLPD